MVFPVFVDSVQWWARLSCAHSGHSSLLAMNADSAFCGQLRGPSRKQAKCAPSVGLASPPDKDSSLWLMCLVPWEPTLEGAKPHFRGTAPADDC